MKLVLAILIAATLVVTTAVASPPHVHLTTFNVTAHPFRPISHRAPPSPSSDVMPRTAPPPVMKYRCWGFPLTRPVIVQLPEWVYSGAHPNEAACAIIMMLHRRCFPDIKTWSFAEVRRVKLLRLHCMEYSNKAESAPGGRPHLLHHLLAE